jgi:H+/Cl- antiporter ClcA
MPVLKRVWNFYCEVMSFDWLTRWLERLFQRNPVYPYIVIAIIMLCISWIGFYFRRIEGRGISDRNLAYEFLFYWSWPLFFIAIIIGLLWLVFSAYDHRHSKKRRLHRK